MQKLVYIGKICDQLCKKLYFTDSVISDSGISVPPLDWESPIDFDAPAPPRGYYSWAATVQAEMGDPRPMTKKEMKQR